MSELQQFFTMSAMKSVMDAFRTYAPNALAITYGDIWRSDVTEDGQKLLTQWATRLREDRRKIAKLAKIDRDWTDDELVSLRSLYVSRTRLIRECYVRHEAVKQYLAAQMSLADRIDEMERQAGSDREAPERELPF